MCGVTWRRGVGMGRESDDFFELASTAHNSGLFFPCRDTCEHLEEHSCVGGLDFRR